MDTDSLDRLAKSGLINRWVKERCGTWDHLQWVSFLETATAQFGPLSADPVGLLLEAEKKSYWERIERAKTNRKQWRLILLVAFGVVFSLLCWWFYNPGLGSLLGILATVAASLYRKLSSREIRRIELRTWTVIVLLVVGLPAYVVIRSALVISRSGSVRGAPRPPCSPEPGAPGSTTGRLLDHSYATYEVIYSLPA